MHLTLTAGSAVLPNGEILAPAFLEIKNGIFTRIESKSWENISDNHLALSDHTLFPGFVNAHCHLDLTGVGILPKAPFAQWAATLMRKRASLSDSATAAGVREGSEKLLRSGVVRIFDHIDVSTPLSCYEQLPLEIIGFGEVLGLSRQRAEQVLNEWSMAQKAAAIPFHLTPHSAYALETKSLRELLTEEPGPFSIHVQESAEENQFFTTNSGALKDFLTGFASAVPTEKSALRVLANSWQPEKKLLAIHANYLDDEDIRILKNLRATVAHCPGSFAYFGHDHFPLHKLRGAAIPIALGTDSLSSNDGLNFLHEVQKFLERFPNLSLRDVTPILAENAMHAAGLSGGKIAVGYSADLTGFANNSAADPMELLKTRNTSDFVMLKGKALKLT